MVEVIQADENAVRDMILRLAACDPASADEVMLNAFAAYRISSLSGVGELVEAAETVVKRAGYYASSGGVVASVTAAIFELAAALSRFREQSKGRDLGRE